MTCVSIIDMDAYQEDSLRKSIYWLRRRTTRNSPKKSSYMHARFMQVQHISTAPVEQVHITAHEISIQSIYISTTETTESRVSTPWHLGLLSCSTNPDHLSLHNPRTPPSYQTSSTYSGSKRQFSPLLKASPIRSREFFESFSPFLLKRVYPEVSTRAVVMRLQHDKKGRAKHRKGRGSQE
jgi:hypothetical protein